MRERVRELLLSDDPSYTLGSLYIGKDPRLQVMRRRLEDGQLLELASHF